MMLNYLNITILAFLTLSVVLHTVSPILSVYADKCEHKDDSKCGSKDVSSSKDENCKVSNQDNNSEKSNNNVQNSEDQSSSSIECTENESESNPHSLGEGPYNYPTDFSQLPI
ncbi:MAG TPA: hypothetical protein VH415_13250 [Nitrososphaeraceae archaeon]